MRRRLAPVFTLALLSPFVAEFLLGDQWLTATTGPVAQLAMFVVLGTWYGAGAVVIREMTRRTGRGWPTMLLLGASFGLLEEGLLTQSLFNPHYLGLDLLSYGHVGRLGIGVPWTLFVLTLHVVWSTATPIALVEGLWPGRHPWLGRVGLVVAGMVFLLGALLIFGASWAGGGFVASAGQLISAAVLAVAVAVVALRLPQVHRPRRSGPILPAAGLATLLASGYQLLHHYAPQVLSAWLTIILTVVLLATAVVASIRWQLDVVGLAAGAVLTYCWVGLTNAASHGLPAVFEQLLIIALALAVTAVAVRRRAIRPNDSAADAAAHATSR